MTVLPTIPGLPRRPTTQWLRSVLGDAEENFDAEVISGGLSNVTYRVRWGPDRLVLRRPPLSGALPGAHDMRREFRVLRALADTQVPVPEALAFCDDPSVLGAPFYVMREVPGIVVRSATDAQTLTPTGRRELSERTVDVLVALHDVAPQSVGLGDYGKWGGYAQRQIRTWAGQWQRSKTRECADMDRLIAMLQAQVPSADETVIVHGDYRVDNTIVASVQSPRINAVLDWELSTLGHPVADLATMLTYWHDLGDDERAEIAVAAGITALPGFLRTDELAERYATSTGRDLSELAFYQALSTMKLGVILEGVHNRYLSGQSIGGGYDSVASAVPLLAVRGLRLLA